MSKLKLLLHSCCAPCSTSVIEKLKDIFDVTVFYYNPNIYPNEEYQKRLEEQKRFLKTAHPDIKLIEGAYNPKDFEAVSKGYETCEEGGERCKKCIYLRLEKTAQTAFEKHFDIFGSTLSVSPHKDARFINQSGRGLEEKCGTKFLEADFKKEDGYLKSIKLSKQFGLYRQTYCGCKFSLGKK